MWQAARSDWCSSEERKPRNTEKTNNERKKRSNSHDFASICINFASVFLLYLSSSLLSSPSSLVVRISFDTYHYSLAGNPPHAKRTPFISTHQPSHPKYGISQAALDLTHLTLMVGFCSSTVSLCVQGFQLIHGANAIGFSCISKRLAFLNH